MAAALAFPGKVFAVSNIPIRVPEHFLGREDSLAIIEKALSRYEGRVAITALHGLRGVGKTTLAAAYAEQHRGNYRATWWIRAQTPEGMRADLIGLGVRLGWIAADDKEDPALATVMERLRHEGEGILLIYDNATDPDQLKPHLPLGGAVRVLVTSNAYAWRDLAEPIEIRLWPAWIGADYLIARTGRSTERMQAEALSNALGGLPLAHEQAAAYCEQLEISFAAYHRRFEAEPVRFLDDQHYTPAEHNDGMTVAKSFALAIEEASKKHPAAELLISHVAVLAPEPIPLFLFDEAREKFTEPLASALIAEGLDEIVAALRLFALVQRGPIVDERDREITTDTISLHRLVREVAVRRSSVPSERARQAIVAAMAAVYPEDCYADAKLWPRARRLDALALPLVSERASLPAGSELSCATLLNGLARFRQGALAAFDQARLLLERSLAIRESVIGVEHLDTATSLNNLALLLWAQGENAKAQQRFEQALQIREKLLGTDDPITALTLNNLGVLVQLQGDLDAARPFKERALAIRENKLGPEHPRTATSLHSLALLLREQGDLAKAQELCERALAICEKAADPDNPNTATVLIGLSLLHQEQGDRAGAWPFCERALAIREKLLGPEHPDTATSLSNRASLLQELGDFAQARPLFERAVAIHDKIYGAEHPETAASLNNLALLLHAQGDLAAARPLFERALTIREKLCGVKHPHTAISLNNLARLLQAQGDYAGAEPLYKRALATCEKVLGSEHPTTNRVRCNLATLLLVSGCAEQALVLGEAALAGHQRALGADRSWTKQSADVTASALEALGRAARAAALRQTYGIGCIESAKGKP